MQGDIIFAAVTLVVVAIGLWKYRYDYKKLGRTTKLGAVAILAAFTMPNIVVGLFVPWIGFPDRAVEFVGWVLLLIGSGLCLIAMIRFRAPRKVLGMATEGLVESGLYRYSRNPQYVFYGMFLLGFVLCGNSRMAFLGVALYWLVVHLTILIEEEHLTRAYGNAYQEYKRTTPRYLLY